MPLTLNDTIELLKAILEECGIEYIVLIISLMVVDWTVLFPSFNAIKTHRISFDLSQFSCSFYENLDKIYQEIPCKSSFFPLSFCLLPLLFLPSEGVKSAIGATFSCSKGIFSSFLCKKNNPVFLAILAWVMWFSVDNGDWLFRG